MKRMHLGASLLLLTACTAEPQLSTIGDTSFEAFRADVPRTAAGGYLFDTDILLDEANLHQQWLASQPGALLVARSGNQDAIWSAERKRDLTYCVSDRFGARKAMAVAAMLAASEQGWELMADVDFHYVPAEDAACDGNNGKVFFHVVPTADNDPGYLASAFFPGNARAFREVDIAPAAFNPNLREPLKNIMGHELGHTLGFRHEHIRAEAIAKRGDLPQFQRCLEGGAYRDVTAYDSASVMHYPQCGGTSQNLAFTNLDRQGVAALYGPPRVNAAPVAQLREPADGERFPAGEALEVLAEVTDEDLKTVELRADDQLVEQKATGPFAYTIATLSAGTHTLAIRAIDGKGQPTTASVTIHIDAATPAEPTATGGNEATPELATAGGCQAVPDPRLWLWIMGVWGMGHGRPRLRRRRAV